jgi:hypothetical protein
MQRGSKRRCGGCGGEGGGHARFTSGRRLTENSLVALKVGLFLEEAGRKPSMTCLSFMSGHCSKGRRTRTRFATIEARIF